MRLLIGDCVELIAELEDDSIDAVVCDPPYGIGFMGHEWDQPGRAVAGREGVPPGQRRSSQPARSGFDLEGNGAQEAGRYDLSRSANKQFQEWVEAWARECYRVLKPGGHLLSFGGTRTYHRLTSGVEDAGFEIRDCVQWWYGSGFPKSLDVGKAIDKAQGAEGGWRQEDHPGRPGTRTRDGSSIGQTNHSTDENPDGLRHVYEPETDDAKEWDGWGTALKPANEPICVARKPLAGTVAANVLRHGTGALNIDGTRIAFRGEGDERETKDKNQHEVLGSGARGNRVYGEDTRPRTDYDAPGRWPANVILSHDERCVQVGAREVSSDGHFPRARPGGVEVGTVGHAGQDELEERHTRGETVEVWECVPGCPVQMLDEQSGITLSSGGANAGKLGARVYGDYANEGIAANAGGVGDKGGASRFFYCAKTSRAERNAGLDGFDEKQTSRWDPTSAMGKEAAESEWSVQRNDHPTVKPIDLMRWLIRLVTPPGGTVLDPFAGSGTTGCAAAIEGAEFVGIERDPHYAAIAEARIRFWQEHGEDGLRIVALRDRGEQARQTAAAAGQLDMFAQHD